jgi:hypothetical protein
MSSQFRKRTSQLENKRRKLQVAGKKVIFIILSIKSAEQIIIINSNYEQRAYCFAAVCLSVHHQFPFTFFALVAHTEMKFGLQIYHKNIYVFCFGYDRAILTELCPLNFKNFQ